MALAKKEALEESLKNSGAEGESEEVDSSVEIVRNATVSTRKSIERLVILEALFEAAVRAGDIKKARCTAHSLVDEKVVMKPVDYSSLLRTIKVLTGVGFSAEAQAQMMTWFPEVAIRRNAAMAHALALTYFETGDWDEFIRWEASAEVAFDADDLTLSEVAFVQSTLAGNVEEEAREAGLEQEMQFWPARLRVLVASEDRTEEESELYSQLAEALEEAKEEAKKDESKASNAGALEASNRGDTIQSGERQNRQGGK